MDTPINWPTRREDAAINAERLLNEARHAQKENNPGLALLLLMEAQTYATLSTRPYHSGS